MINMVIAGGDGFAGRALCLYFLRKSYCITVLTRKQQVKNPIEGVNYKQWDGKTLGAWTEVLNRADVLINLVGRSVDCRYTRKNKEIILNSRVLSTRVLGKAVAACANPPKLWINSSTATIYRHAEDRPMDEFTGEIGEGFSVNVAKAWEKEFFDSKTSKTRKVALRMAMVLGSGGGVLPVLARLVRFGVGGKIASGKQYMSWLHEEDMCRIMEFFITHQDAEGIYNASAPHPLQNKNFMRLMRSTLHVPIGMPHFVPTLELAAFVLRTETELVLKSRWVLPTRLEKEGFVFKYPQLHDALEDLLHHKPMNEAAVLFI